MAHLRRDDGTLVPLASRTLAGRSPSCALRLEGDRASREHAVIAWTPEGMWSLRDLGSRNGTFADGGRLVPGEVRLLVAGAVLGFGDARDRWVLEDDEPPGMVVIDTASGAATEASGGMVALPSEEEPLVTLYERADGRWVQHFSDRDPLELADECVVSAAGRSYLVFLPVATEGTPIAPDQPSLGDIQLELSPSLDEEVVDIRFRYRGARRELGPREHGYLLLVLARRRLEDAALPASEQGWIDRDELLRMLRTSAAAVDLLVHRARKQLAESGVRGAGGLIEVRRGARRLGTMQVTIRSPG